MFLKAIRNAIVKLWPIALSVAAAALLGLYLRTGPFTWTVAALVAAVALVAVILVGVPAEYHKLKHQSRV